MLASKGKLGLLQLPSLEMEVGSLFTDTHEVAGYMFDVKEYLLPLFVFFCVVVLTDVLQESPVSAGIL